MVQRTTNEELKRKLERDQDERLAKLNQDEKLTNEELKKKLIAEQDEKLRIQAIHSSREWKTNDEEKIRLVEVKDFDDCKMGFYGEVKPCDGFIERHGEKWAVDTDIYLTFSYWKTLANLVKNEKGYWDSAIKHDEKPTKIKKNYCLYCAKEAVSNWNIFLFNSFKNREKERLDEALKNYY